MQKPFVKAGSYCTYRLKNKSQRYTSKVAPKVTKLVKKLRSLLHQKHFKEMHPISILAFLEKFGDARDSIDSHEEVATWLF